MKKWCLLFLLCLSLFTYTLPASAHANLLSSSPTQGAVLKTTPTDIRLLFTTSIDPTVYEFDVLDKDGVSVLPSDTKLRVIKNELTASISSQTTGELQIVYSVISKDGHPIKGVIHFKVSPESKTVDLVPKESPISEEMNMSPNQLKTGGDQSPSAPRVLNKMTASKSTLHSMIKFLYVTSLLILAGLLMWESRGFRSRFLPMSQIVHLVLLFLFTWSQANAFLSIFDQLTWGDLFLRTAVGQYWTASLIVSVFGLYMIGRNRMINLLLVGLLLLLKSLNSHAVASELPFVTVSLNVIHLGLAALWVGGLFFLITSWKQAQTKAFLPVFSRAALISIVSLSVTGTIYALLLAPSIHILWTTAWGLWLSAKILTVLCVFIVGGVIRRRMKFDGDLNHKKILYVDFGLSLLILFIVGFLTQLSPN